MRLPKSVWVLAFLPLWVGIAVPANEECMLIDTEGRRTVGRLRDGQSIMIQTESGERTAGLGDVLWMVGEAKKTVRLRGSLNRSSGTVSGRPIQVETSEGERAFKPSDLAFLFNGTLPAEVSDLIVIDSGETFRWDVLESKEIPPKCQVTLYAANWEGDIRLSKPRYPSKLRGNEVLSLELDFEAGPAIFRDVSRAVVEREQTTPLALILTYRMLVRDPRPGGATGYWVMDQKPLGPEAEAGHLPTGSQSRRSVVFKTVLISPGGRLEGRSNVLAYVAASAAGLDWSFFREFAHGSVKVARTASNVLEIPIEVESSREE